MTTLKDIVKRAINDDDFRKHLMEKPEEALAEYVELAEEDKELFINAKGKDFKELMTELSPRISKAGLGVLGDAKGLLGEGFWGP
jgi:hypothetical protein